MLDPGNGVVVGVGIGEGVGVTVGDGSGITVGHGLRRFCKVRL